LENLVARSGILVLASHDELIRRRCSKAILLEKGRSVNVGPIEDILAQYRSELVPPQLIAEAATQPEAAPSAA